MCILEMARLILRRCFYFTVVEFFTLSFVECRVSSKIGLLQKLFIYFYFYFLIHVQIWVN